jgi:all-trans-retinol dehydrogenase (NAD+)
VNDRDGGILRTDLRIKICRPTANIVMEGTTNKQTVGWPKKLLSMPFRTAAFIALEPVATGLGLFVLTTAPAGLRDHLLGQFARDQFSRDHYSGSIMLLKCLFALGVSRRLHQGLKQFAENYYHLRPQGEPWKFSDAELTELIVITGGCSGFGALMTKGFVGHARVVILDIQDLPEDLATRETDITSFWYFADAASSA